MEALGIPKEKKDMCLRSIYFNPLMPNIFSHPYQMEGSFFNFRVVGWYFSFLFKF